MKLKYLLGIPWTLIFFFLYILLCFWLAIEYPVHVYALPEYVSTERARQFWYILSAGFLAVTFIHVRIYSVEKDAIFSLPGCVLSGLGIISLYCFFLVSSLQLFEFVNAFDTHESRNNIKLAGQVNSKSIQKCTRYKECYFLTIYSGETKSLIARQVAKDLYEQAGVGQYISITYKIGRLGVAFQNGDLDTGIVEQ
ncbi:hypothetical protein [Bdellovibrio sp. HCB-110]|uniref:hypothetical protein n=1 Tax=Bdellovibrio sp. HCB-110 TaxID=3391182 RepID=UPI0039B3DBF0